MLSNELAVGDLVQVRVGGEWIGPVGVAKVQDGGISMALPQQPGQPVPETPDILVVQLVVTCPGKSGMPQGCVLKLVKPDTLPSGMVQ